MRRRATPACGLLILAITAGCAARETRPAVRPAGTLPAADALQRDLHAIFTAPAVDHAVWGVNIQSLSHGDTLYSYNAFRFLLPASNQKLLTTAVAAERLGWDYRFTTRVLATGAVDASGTLTGDLIIVGSGDPTINPRHADRAHAFDGWAAQLQARGIRAITGRIIGDDSAFDEPGLGFGWAWDNLPFGYGTAVGALQYNESQFVLTVAPGASAGAPPLITAEPPTHGLQIVSRLETAPPGTETRVEPVRRVGSTRLELRGQIAAGSPPVSTTLSVENPTRFYVESLRHVLARHGIASAGAVDVDELSAPVDTDAAAELFVDQSPPLVEIVDVCLKWSRNEYAETLLHALSASRPATVAAGLEILTAQLAAWGIPPEYVAPRDGSGLSRQDYVTAHALTALLTYVWMDPRHATSYRSALPVSGASGSLADRMTDTALAGRVWAKTGTLSNVRSLSGYLLTRSGEPVVFAMMVNNFQLATPTIDETMERALLRVFEYLR